MLKELSSFPITLKTGLGGYIEMVFEGNITIYWDSLNQKLITKTTIIFEGEWISLEEWLLDCDDIKIEITKSIG